MEPNATKTTAAALKVAKEKDNTTDGILEQLDTFKNLLDSKMKETEHLIFQDACEIFLNNLPERFGSIVRNYDKERKPAAAISGGGASTVRVPRKKPKKKGICYDYNEGKCERGDECFFQHITAPKKILDEQRMEAKVAKKNKTTSQVKKCKACDGDHRVEKCPIMLRGNKALKDQEEAGDEVNSMYLLSIQDDIDFFCSETSEWERITEAEKLSETQLAQSF